MAAYFGNSLFRQIDIDYRGQALLQDRQREFESRQHFSIDRAQSIVLIRKLCRIRC
jgi:hypothetical protein